MLKLRFSNVGHNGMVIRSDQAKDVLGSGEIVCAYNETVATRHIRWQKSKEGLMTEESPNVAFMAELLDGSILPEMMRSDFIEPCQKIHKRIEKFAPWIPNPLQ